jgi:hypothetical protein
MRRESNNGQNRTEPHRTQKHHLYLPRIGLAQGRVDYALTKATSQACLLDMNSIRSVYDTLLAGSRIINCSGPTTNNSPGRIGQTDLHPYVMHTSILCTLGIKSRYHHRNRTRLTIPKCGDTPETVADRLHFSQNWVINTT